MERISHKLTNYILKKGIIKSDNYDIYQYGFQCFLEVSISIICSISIALLLHMLPECFFFFLLFIPMRSFCGGLHFKNYLLCLVFSLIVLSSTLMVTKFISVPCIVSLGIYLFCALAILIIGPVDHPNREVEYSDDHVFKLKTYYTLLVNLILAIIFSVIGNREYLFLQAIIFFYIFLTTFIGRIVYKKNTTFIQH